MPEDCTLARNQVPEHDHAHAIVYVGILIAWKGATLQAITTRVDTYIRVVSNE